MEADKFQLVDGLLADDQGVDQREVAMSMLEAGLREGTLLDVAETVSVHYCLRRTAVIEWFGERLTRRVQDARSILAQYQEAALCRLGHCREKNSHYSGGDKETMDKLKQGICPVCGGPAVKPGSEVDVRS